MKKFEEIITPMAIRKGESNSHDAALPALQQKMEAEEFVSLLKVSRLHLWQPGDPIFASGRRILLGVMSASRYDLQLLDILNKAIQDGITGTDHFDVFNFPYVSSLEEALQYIPDISPPGLTPMVSRWENGVYIGTKYSSPARDELLKGYGLY